MYIFDAIINGIIFKFLVFTYLLLLYINIVFFIGFASWNLDKLIYTSSSFFVGSIGFSIYVIIHLWVKTGLLLPI